MGPFEINASPLDYSTGWLLANNKYNIFSSDRWFEETMHEMLSFDRSHQVHQFKFEVWKQSMYLIGMSDIAFARDNRLLQIKQIQFKRQGKRMILLTI